MNARKILADLRVVDGAKVLAPRLYQNPAGLEALLREHGEFAERGSSTWRCRPETLGLVFRHVPQSG